MSDSQRSSSGVRNLRAVFEIADSSDSLSPNRGRSPSGSVGGASNAEKSPAASKTRKVRTSFVSVDPTGQLLAENSDLSNRIRPKMSSEQRREVTDLDGSNEIGAGSGSGATAAVPTPIAGMSDTSAALDRKKLGSFQEQNGDPSSAVVIPDDETQSEHPEKVTSAVEDQDAKLLPADLTVMAAVSGGEALPNGRGDPAPSLKKTSAQPSNVASAGSKSRQSVIGKPAGPSKSTDSSKRISTEIKSPTQKSASSAKARPKSPTRPVRLSSHLTQPTASYAAKHETAPSAATKLRSSPGSRKVIGVSSHLMAPTAASKAKHEPETTSSSSNATSSTRPRTSILPKRDRTSLASSTNSAATRKAPVKSSRASLAPSADNAASKPAETKPPSEGFLSRMMKPTSATSSKTQEKIEGKSPPRPSATSASQPAAVKKSTQAPPVKTTSVAPASKGRETTLKSQVVSKPARTSAAQSKPAAKSTSATIPSGIQPTPVEAATPIAQSMASEESAPVKKDVPVTNNVVAEATIPAEEAAPTEKAVPIEKSAPTEEAVPSIPIASSENAIPAESSKTAAAAPSVGTDGVKLAPKKTVNGTTEDAVTPPQFRSTNAIEEWNAAALPQTPLMKREDIKKKPSKAAEHARRSMMETPELEGATIH